MNTHDNPDIFHRGIYSNLHKDNCNCDTCHDYHELEKNFGSPDFRCCTEEVIARIWNKLWCSQEPQAHGNAGMYKGECDLCKEEAEIAKGMAI